MDYSTPSTKKNSRNKNPFQTSFIRAIHNAENPYTQVRNETIRDASLSFGALGLLTYIFSHCDTWKITPKSLWGNRKEGKDKLYSLFRELIEEGYATRLTHQITGKKGQFTQCISGYAFFEVKATQEDIEKVQEEFKLFFRNTGNQDPGTLDKQKEHTERKTDSVSVKEQHSVSVHNSESEIEKKSINGGMHKCSKDLYWSYCIKYEKPWNKEEIEIAWNVLLEYDNPITCWQKFLDGIILSRREKCKSQKKDGQKSSETIKSDTSEKDTEEQACPKATSSPKKYKNLLWDFTIEGILDRKRREKKMKNFS